ncbi:hypothetical protein [Prevotella sp. 10(H)]|uniref:hypothetical protein n=1 Tax=Prevotella sp. 10(H) TaxID=1158294 RepID=UPI0004A72068|nr:hypothetical protein [Prevotella sp. 10(H)]
MRLTTKIVLGIIIAVFVIAISYICYTSLNYDENMKRGFSLGEEMVEMDVLAQGAVEIRSEIFSEEYRKKHDMSDFYKCCDGNIEIKQSNDKAQIGKIFVPKKLKEYVSYSTENKKLIIDVKIQSLIDDLQESEEKESYINDMNFIVYVDSLVNVSSNITGIRASAKDLDAREINLDVTGADLEIINCTADIVRPLIRNWGRFTMKDSKTAALDIDLDHLHNWTIDKCDIDTENLTGSRDYYINLPKSECKVMNWNPKNENASVRVTLGSDTAKIMFP